ncbi:MAG: DUF2812 domain-containing protein [Oscillibacter sp.]|nr:DUF2812 domain-containing protein [Oscillibacter sp.]
MRNTKYRMETLQLFDFKGMEEHLEDMAADGWRLEETGRFLWKYRRTEPARVHYAVTYSLDASEFNPSPTEGQLSLEELCAEAGWQKVCDWMKMQIFVSEQETPVPLETDEAMRLEVIHKVMERRLIPAAILLGVIAVFQFSIPITSLIWNPVRFFENEGYLWAILLWTLMIVYHGFHMCHYYRWYRRSLQSTAHGGPCAEVKPYQLVDWVFFVLTYALLAIFLVRMLKFTRTGVTVVWVVHITLYTVFLILINQAPRLLRKLRVSRGTNIVVCFVVLPIIYMIVAATVIFGILGDNQAVRYAEDTNGLPLTLEMLTGVSHEDSDRSVIPLGIGSFMLTQHLYADQGTRMTSEGVKIEESFYYTIKDVKTDWLYGKVLAQYLEPKEDRDQAWEMQDAAPWEAERVYRSYLSGEAVDSYLLCFPGRLVELTFTKFDIPLTAVQMAVIGRALAPSI